MSETIKAVKSIKYYINHENGIVVAKLDDMRRENSEMCAHFSLFNFWGFDEFSDKMIRYINTFPDSYVGMAKCHPGDNFDEERGKELARARLLVKVNNAKAKIMHHYMKQIDEIKDSITKVENHYLNRVSVQEKKIEDILGRIEG